MLVNASEGRSFWVNEERYYSIKFVLLHVYIEGTKVPVSEYEVTFFS